MAGGRTCGGTAIACTRAHGRASAPAIDQHRHHGGATRGEMNFDPTPPHGAHDDVFVGDSDMARLMRAHDWAATPLGPVSGWASSLKVALGLLLTSRFEMWLGWGDG